MTEQETIRRQALKSLKKLGINPYPAQYFEVNETTQHILANYRNQESTYNNVALAGRIMSKRVMGNASFAELQDASGRIQIYLRRDSICPDDDKTLYNTVFKKILDIGDIIGITGHVFTTKTGEISVHVDKLVVLSKSLRPLPVIKETKTEGGRLAKHDAFTDPEQRYRMRYLDLIVNPHIRNVFIMRAKTVNSMRQYLNNKGYLEVETPILQPLYGGAAARPFKTHHHALDTQLYLRIANELYLKRLIIGGFDGVYEFGKDFRNEGMSRFHNPEFTQMELYVAYKDYEWMMNLVETMIEKVALDLHGTTNIQVGQHHIDFKKPWKRYTMYESVKNFTDIDISEMDEPALRATCKKLHIPVDDSMGKGRLVDEIFSKKCEPHLIQPTYITDYPIAMSPLAKKHRKTPGLVERFEAICNGKEICNAFSELNDPIDQRTRFTEQLLLGKRGDEEAMTLDEDYLKAMEYGMPPMAGLGIGIDRLVMILTNSPSIQDVIFFPQMRLEQTTSKHTTDSPTLP